MSKRDTAIKEYTSNNEQDTENIATGFVKTLDPNTNNVVGLIGELGAGKTRFVQCVARCLGVEGTVNSPTFLIMRSYQIHTGAFSSLYHFDWYRIVDTKEISVLGWDTIVSDNHNLVFVEWADRGFDLLPEQHIKIFFQVTGKNRRNISIHYEK